MVMEMMRGKRRDLGGKTRKCVIESKETECRASIGDITVMRANELHFLDLVMGRWSFHSVFAIF